MQSPQRQSSCLMIRRNGLGRRPIGCRSTLRKLAVPGCLSCRKARRLPARSSPLGTRGSSRNRESNSVVCGGTVAGCSCVTTCCISSDLITPAHQHTTMSAHVALAERSSSSWKTIAASAGSCPVPRAHSCRSPKRSRCLRISTSVSSRRWPFATGVLFTTRTSSIIRETRSPRRRITIAWASEPSQAAIRTTRLSPSSSTSRITRNTSP